MKIVYPTDILLPKVKDMTAWSVVACDQFTSQPDYWAAVEKRVGGAPSTLNMILPEAYLNKRSEQDAERRIYDAMEEYLAAGLLKTYENSAIYLERTFSDGRVRRGLLAAIDLEQYDFAADNPAPVRATEETVENRLPARLRIRAGAALELPHVMLLMDDGDDRVLGPLETGAGRLKKLYDFELMLGGGRIAGWQVTGSALDAALSAVDSLAEPDLQREKYGGTAATGPLALAVGDGNHSLAAAKRHWERVKEKLSSRERENHPARFALAELCNIHDPAMEFYPIHRVIFDTDAQAVARAMEGRQGEWEDPSRPMGERVAAADAFCREQIAAHGGRVDYIHGEKTARELAARPGCAALILPPVDKNRLFADILAGGALPRKSFSIGRAEEKRYYLECRAIR